ncbi:MAG: hypothetical protein HQK52_22270 [Oligoflexia bacterium]|nr:hypothetical protein [Oligoflexia bacterium]
MSKRFTKDKDEEITQIKFLTKIKNNGPIKVSPEEIDSVIKNPIKVSKTDCESSSVLKKTEDKLETNYRQTTDKLETELETNCGQTRDKLETSYRQTDNKLETNYRQTRDTTRDNEKTNYGQTRDKLETNYRQTRDNFTEDDSPIDQFTSLSGTQRSLVLTIYVSCKFEEAKIAPPMSSEHLAQMCQKPVSSIRKSIDRLKEKKIIKVAQSKEGRGGWCAYRLNKAIYNEMLQLETGNKLETNCRQTRDKLETNYRQTRDKLGTELGTELETQPSSSNSSINNINTNTTSTNPDATGREWLEIQTPEILKPYGFGKNIIDQVRNRGYLSAEKLQESLDNFAHDIACNQLLKKNPNLNAVRYFMGATKKSQVWISSGFRDPEEEALDNLIKRREEQLRQKKEKEEKLKNIEFELWLGDLPESVKRDPKHCIGEFMGTFHKLNLKTLFEEEFWPQKLGQINGEIRKN